MDSVLFLVGLDLTNEYLGKELLVDFVFLGTVKLRERFGAAEHLIGIFGDKRIIWREIPTLNMTWANCSSSSSRNFLSTMRQNSGK